MKALQLGVLNYSICDYQLRRDLYKFGKPGTPHWHINLVKEHDLNKKITVQSLALQHPFINDNSFSSHFLPVSSSRPRQNGFLRWKQAQVSLAKQGNFSRCHSLNQTRKQGLKGENEIASGSPKVATSKRDTNVVSGRRGSWPGDPAQWGCGKRGAAGGPCQRRIASGPSSHPPLIAPERGTDSLLVVRCSFTAGG